MAIKHTPSPWHAGLYCGEPAILDDRSGVICRFQQPQDAPVLAMAPEMYAAIKALVAAATFTAGGQTILPGKGGYQTGNLGAAFEAACSVLAKVAKANEGTSK